MIYLALGCALLALFIWGGKRSILKRREWRFGSGVLAVCAFAGAALVTLRGHWEFSLALTVLGVWLAVSTRRAGTAQGARPAAAPDVGLAEARAILGVDADSTPAEIKAAYTRLMRMAHPDKGGTAGLAAQLNAARDRLLRR